MSIRMYFLTYIIVVIFSFNIAYAEDPFKILSKPTLSEIQGYMDSVNNIVSRTLSNQVSPTNSSFGGSSSRDILAQIASLTQQFETSTAKLSNDYIVSNLELTAAFSNIMNQIAPYGFTQQPTAPGSLTAVSGRWTITAVRISSVQIGFGDPAYWRHTYNITSVTDSSTGKTYADTPSAIIGINTDYLNKVMQITTDWLAAISALYAESGLPEDFEAIFGSKFEPLQPLSTVSKFESRFNSSPPGRFDRWIDDLVPGEIKKLGPPFSQNQVLKFKEMKHASDRAEQLAREKEQQNEQRERIEQDPFLNEEQKKHAREYYASNYVNLTDKENAEYAGLYKSAEDFARMEKENDDFLSKVDTNKLDHKQLPQVDDTVLEEYEDSEPSAVNDLIARGKELGSSLSGVVTYGVQTIAEGVAQLNNLPIAPVSLAVNVYQSAQSGETIGEKLGEIYFGEEGMLRKGVNIALSGFNETEIEYYWKHDIPDAAKRSMEAVVESVAPGVAGPVLGKIIRSR